MGFGLSVILLIGLRFVGIFLALALARLAHRPWLGLRFVQAPLPAQYVADSQRPGPPQSLPAWPVAAHVPVARELAVVPEHNVCAPAPAFRRWRRRWLRVLRCANQSGWALLSLPDHSSPVNTALLVLRPNASLYREGVAALLHSDGEAAVPMGDGDGGG